MSASPFSADFKTDLERISLIEAAERDSLSEADVEWVRSLAGEHPRKVEFKIVRASAVNVLRKWDSPPGAAADGPAPAPKTGPAEAPAPNDSSKSRDLDPATIERALRAANPTSEEHVLASAIQNAGVRELVLGSLCPADFLTVAHRVTFEHMTRLDSHGPFDLDLLIGSFAGLDELKYLEGGDVLRRLARRDVDVAATELHVEAVRSVGARRGIVLALKNALADVVAGRVAPERVADLLAGVGRVDREQRHDAVGWPEPPDAAVWHGPAGEIVRAVEPHTEADPVAVLAQFLVIFGNLIGRTAHCSLGGRKHFCNLSVALVGPTSLARKGTAFDVAEKLMAGIDEGWDANFPLRGLCSGEGFISAVRDPDVLDKRALWFEAEFGSTAGVIARDGNNLSGKVREAFDHGNLASASKVDPVRATDAHVSIVGHTTFREIRENLSPREVSNGFVNRFMWLCSRMSKVLPSGGDLGLLDLDAHRRSIERAYGFSQSRSVATQSIPLDTESQNLWAVLYRRLLRPRPGRLAEVTARSYVIVRRLAVVYAVLDRSRQVRRPHLEAAAALWDYAERSARFIFHEGESDRLAQRVYDLVEAAGKAGATRNELGRKALHGRHLERLGPVLESLASQGLVAAETQKRPAPTEVWRVLG